MYNIVLDLSDSLIGFFEIGFLYVVYLMCVEAIDPCAFAGI